MKETLTSRERLLKALNHQIPDRVPIDLGGFQSGIHRKAYENLLKYLRIKDDNIKILDCVQQLAVPCEELLQRFHVDIRYIWPHSPDSFDGSIKKNRRGGRLWHDFTDEFGVVWSMPDDGGLYMDISHHPLAEVTTEQLRKRPFPNGADRSRFSNVREKALAIRKKDYALSTTIGGSMYEYGWYQRGLERWFMDMIENPRFCETLLDKMLAFWKDYYTSYMAEVSDLVDVVQIGDDVAGQYGLLFSPGFYRSTIKPRLKQLIKHIKSLTSAKIWYHTCGGCSELIPDLIECGIDILNPVQISADNMDPEKLKKNFGKKLVLWGGACDTQHFLPFASPQQVAEQVRKNIEIFKPGGGYVFNNVHNIQSDVPVQNIVAMFEAAYEFGFYK